MTPTEVAKLLAVISGYDSTAVPAADSQARLKIEAWHAALDTEMPFGFARDAVIRHHATVDTAVTVALLNVRWRAAIAPRGLPPDLRERAPDPPSVEYVHARAELGAVRMVPGVDPLAEGGE